MVIVLHHGASSIFHSLGIFAKAYVKEIAPIFWKK